MHFLVRRTPARAVDTRSLRHNWASPTVVRTTELVVHVHILRHMNIETEGKLLLHEGLANQKLSCLRGTNVTVRLMKTLWYTISGLYFCHEILAS